MSPGRGPIWYFLQGEFEITPVAKSVSRGRNDTGYVMLIRLAMHVQCCVLFYNIFCHKVISVLRPGLCGDNIITA